MYQIYWKIRYKFPTNQLLEVISLLQARMIKGYLSKRIYKEVIIINADYEGQGAYKKVEDHEQKVKVSS